MTEQQASSTADASEEDRLNTLRALGLLELAAELLRENGSVEKHQRWVKLFADLLGVEERASD
jgi:hypothetical protein